MSIALPSLFVFAAGQNEPPRRTYPADRIVAVVAGRPSKQYLMWTLAGLTAASVLYVLIGGGLAQ